MQIRTALRHSDSVLLSYANPRVRGCDFDPAFAVEHAGDAPLKKGVDYFFGDSITSFLVSNRGD